MHTDQDQFLSFRVALVLTAARIDAVADPAARYALEQLRLAVLELARAQGFTGPVDA